VPQPLSSLEALPTPSALVEVSRLEANCRRMAERVRQLGVSLRPHVKTHKTVPAARLQLAGLPPRITVSTLAEANAFADAGFDDITYAVPIAPQRLAAAIHLAQRIRRFTILVDHPHTARQVAAAAAAAGVRLSVLLEVDCGAHRCGVDPSHPDSVALAAHLARSPHLDFRGVLTHAGHAYACRTAAELARVAAHERDVICGFAQRLRQADIAVPEVSVGSTPTLSAVDHLAGVTEVRPGNYAFFDAHQAVIGSCSLSQCAFTVLATVIGCYPERQMLVLDAGALALSRDPGPTHLRPDCGFGVVCTVHGCQPIAGLTLVALTQEHGTVLAAAGALAAAHPPGTRLRIIPNHACLAAACFDTYHVVDGEHVVDLWHPCRGW